MNNCMSKRQLRLRRTALAVALGMATVSGAAFAQSTTGTIFGQAPIASGETVLVHGESGFTREVTVGPQGRFTVSSVPVGTYTVTLRRDGKTIATKSNVTPKVGSGTNVSFVNTSASSANAQSISTVTVSANSLPAIDVTDVDSRTVITSQQLSSLPIGRSAEAIALLAPGTVSGSAYFAGANGNQLVSFGGASVTENAYYINGMNVTDPLNGLGGISLPYGSIEQQEILTGGYSAMYGRSDGGVISQVGKSGTNSWHFGGQILYTPKSLYGSYRDSNHRDTGKIYRKRSAYDSWSTTEDAYIGGPLIKDKLFMFVSAEGEREHHTTVSPVSTSATETKYVYDNPKWYAKLNWNINDSNILELTGASSKHAYSGNIYDYSYDTHSRGAFNTADTHTKNAARMWIAKYTGYLTDNLTLSAQYGKQKTEKYSQLGGGFNADLIDILGADQQNPALNGGVNGGIKNSQTILTTTNPAHVVKGANYRLDLTYILGDHTIKVGIDNQRTQDLKDGQYIPENAGYAWEYAQVPNPNSDILQGQVDPPAGYPGGSQGYYVDKYIYGTGASVRVEQRAQYIEDDWQVNDRLLLKLGLRNDQFTNYNTDGKPYISQHQPQLAPRLGFSWDVNGDSSLKIYGNVGRYYLALPTSVALRGASGSLYTRTYYTYTGIDPSTGYPTGLTPINTAKGPGAPISENNEYGQPPDPKTVTATNLKAQYQDEYILGFDKKLNASWTFGAKFTRRVLRNMIDDTCNYELFFAKAQAQGLDTSGLRGCYFFNPGRQATFRLPNGNGGYGKLHLSNAEMGFPHAKRKYYSLDLHLEHPFDGKFWAKIDYLYSRAYGNTEGQVRSDIGQSDIAATVDWDYPSLMQYSNGYLSNDQKHVLKAYGLYQINPQWRVSGNLVLASGRPEDCLDAYGPNGTYPAYTGPYYHWCGGKPSTPGQRGRTPWQHIYSIKAEYRPAFADHKLGFSVYVYNILNEQNGTQVYAFHGYPRYDTYVSFEQPRYVRFGVSYDF